MIRSKKIYLRPVLLFAVLIAFSALVFGAATLADYHSRIQRAISLLDTTSEKGFELNNKEALKALLPEHEQIVNEDQVIDIDNGWISDDVKSMIAETTQSDKDKAYDTLINKLKLIEADVAKLTRSPGHSTEQDQNKMREILDRHEFAVKRGESLIQRGLDWLIRNLQKFFTFIPQRGSGFNKVLRVIVTIISIAVAIMLVIFTVRYFKRDKKVKKETTRTIFGEEITDETTAESLADAARKMAEQGEYRAAIRKLYVSLLFELERQGLLRLQAATTNREYLNKIRQQLGLFPVMSYLTDRFDYFWYGKYSSSQTDFEDFFSRYREALSLRQAQN
jgi:hypothetical protein